MTPAPGERLQRFVGDRVRFTLRTRAGSGPAKGWSARLRTNLGRAEVLRREIIQAHAKGLPLAGASWRDLPMKADADGWSLDLPLTEAGYFKAKAYLVDSKGWQHWPEGPDAGISVHPDAYRTANTIYCAFPRLFGASKTAIRAKNEKLETQIRETEKHGFAILPPSGKLRDLIECLPHIIDSLGCRILHLLPVNSTPTTYARFGRSGSPYAALDLTAIDPALVVFDKRTTGVDQFHELTYATHLRGGRVFLDIVINHTGWGSWLQENHPEWFLRNPDGTFASPGAWGVTWEDLVELKHINVALWDKLAEMLLIWCRRGVDGFRCDAGYKVPVSAWQYIVARVQQEFPETIFLLEGLGGSWDATEALLTEGGMQWAYSELFQNYSGRQVADYLDYGLRQSERVGLYVHYSETHDNNRLAAHDASAGSSPALRDERGRAWSLLRNRLCALTSVSGGYGFTCGVEWLATEKIAVHDLTGLAWGNRDNIVPELTLLNRLLAEHPCFFDGARLTRLSPSDSPVHALLRESVEGKDGVLTLVNNDLDQAQSISLLEKNLGLATPLTFDLLGQIAPQRALANAGEVRVLLPPGSAYCLSPNARPQGLHGDAYRRVHAQSAWAIQALNEIFSVTEIGRHDPVTLARRVENSPFDFLATIPSLDPQKSGNDFQRAFEQATGEKHFPRVVRWNLVDRRRITPVPPDHWLLIEDSAPFRARLNGGNGVAAKNVRSIPVRDGHVACFPPGGDPRDARLSLERYDESEPAVEATIRFLAARPDSLRFETQNPQADALCLLTNGIGGMARLCVDLGRVKSKYDCVLGANLHPSLPVDRHVFAKRLRAWVNADGFLSPLDLKNLASFDPGPPAVWYFVANAGDGRTVEIEMRAEMLEGRNTTVFHLSRPTAARATGKQLPADADVRLTVRVDIEDRNFHSETKRNGGAEFHFGTHISELQKSEIRNPKSESGENISSGFAFTPAADRQLRVFADSGQYHSQPEWSDGIPHPVEQNRGQVGSGDAFSPGWFELPLPKGATIALVVTAETEGIFSQLDGLKHREPSSGNGNAMETADSFGTQLLRAVGAFVVRRGSGKTVIAGYPWFLDWGRDTFICARGLLAAGMVNEVKEIVGTFARFEKQGTLPNTIHGQDASNRDTSDAPLWFGVVCEETAALQESEAEFYGAPIDASGRTIRDVLSSIAANYMTGTPNGIRMDPGSGLVWSPSHFTWMDTNYPAATSREGYPVEIQVLWIRLLRLLEKIDGRETRKWAEAASRATASFEKLFWLEEQGWFADVLLARSGTGAVDATRSDALRSNCLFAVSLGLVTGDHARRCVAAALKHLVIPGALRTLAPLPVSVPLPVYGNDGRLLNDPIRPYWAHYEGDEDTRRKPAYHNGTAWTWTFPVFCEALARAWDFSPEAVAAARAYLGSMDQILRDGCLGQLPEILDGDAPHEQRGCDAQAWGATEALRVWRLLNAH
jgi:predicted glycogen debranching enzyme